MASQVIECGQACTVTVQLEPAPADADRLADYTTLAGLFLAAAVIVFCARRLLDLFRLPNED